jgi:hypothetical protein
MTDASRRWASVSAHITHGTAAQVAIPSVIPEAKQDKEVFWASALVSHLPELQAFNPSVTSCLDDSHGNHDVIVNLDNGESIGIQVTELTYELARARQAQTEKFVTDALACFTKRGLSSKRRLLVNCFVPFVAGNRYVVPKVELLATEIETFLRVSLETKCITVEQTKVLFEWVDEGEFYVPSVAGIGVACNLDALPRKLEMFCDAITCLHDKKANSNSPWLLVWSTSFCWDKHWLGNETLEHMKKAFSASSFERVFFVESMDGPGYFEANFEAHAIKA